MSRRWLLVILSAWTVQAGAAESLPTDLVGEWAIEKSEFSQGTLSRGAAIYLTARGVGVLVGSPPPLLATGPATYDTRTQTLTLQLTAQGGYNATCAFIHDPKAKTFKAQEPECGNGVFKRRRDHVPDHILRLLR